MWMINAHARLQPRAGARPKRMAPYQRSSAFSSLFCLLASSLLCLLASSCRASSADPKEGAPGRYVQVSSEVTPQPQTPATRCPPGRWLDRSPERTMASSPRVREAMRRTLPGLREDLEARGFCLGAPLYLRIFKEERQLEAWLEVDGTYNLYKTFPICHFSGELGPKQKEGDLQAPEGLYTVAPDQLNPLSQYHLAFNLGYPNAFERGQGWTGSFLMVHGSCVSVGCFAMTDTGIESLYLLVQAALEHSLKAVPVHSFPFRMDPARLQAAEAEAPPALEFWKRLLPAYLRFEQTRKPPRVDVRASGYHYLD